MISAATREGARRFALGRVLMLCILCSTGYPAARAAVPAFSVIDRIPGDDGGYDYVSVDNTSRAVFVGRATGVMRIDLKTRKVTTNFVKGEDVAAVLIIPGTPLMLSTNGESNTATLFDRNSGSVKARIPTGKGPDGAFYDTAGKLAFVMNGDGHSATVIDPARGSTAGTVALGGAPEAGVSDGHGHVYINISDRAEIAVVDVKSRKAVARYAMPGCKEPTGMDYDPQSRLLISACRESKVAKLIDSVTGADRGTVAIGDGADGAIFDPVRRLVYIPCGEGFLTIFQLGSSGEVAGVQNVATGHGARTAALDSTTGQLYLPAADFKADAAGEARMVPGSFRVLVVAPR